MKRTGEIEVDLFAGCGGASTGIERATGRPVTVAINHDPAAITMHAANHPRTRHYREDVWKANARKVTSGRPVGLLWASPDCRHFSRAKGGVPVKKEIRSLAWVVVRWAEQVSPRVIVLENVREFEDWGPLVPLWACRGCDWKGTEGQATLVRTRRKCPRCESAGLRQTADQVPCPDRKGLSFRKFTGRLRNLGYAVEWRNLNAADFGAPTHRRRLFLVARNDGEPIQWPEPTHGDPKKIAAAVGDLFPNELKPWLTAASCIDWSLPCPSIFLSTPEGRALGVKRPLADKTLRRIAMGIKRYVLDNPRPFIVDMQRDNRARGTDEPTGTVTTQDNRFNLVTPTLIRFRGTPGGGANIEAPMPTITAGSYIKRPGGAGHALGVCTPVIVPLTHQGERRAHSPGEPLPTVTGANRGEMAVVSPLLVRGSQTGGNGKYTNGVGEPLTTVTSKAEHMLIAPTLYPRHGERDGQAPRCGSVDAPLPTVTATGNGAQLVAALLTKYHGQKGDESRCRPMDSPTNTIDTGPRFGMVAANLVHLNHGEKTESAADEPMRTVTASGTHAALVYSFLVKYFGTAIGQPADAPLHTITGRDRFGVVTVMVEGQPYIIADIGMRMLAPRELARAQGFPDSYALTGSNTNQVARIGNSVPPNLAEAVAGANYVPDQVPACV